MKKILIILGVIGVLSSCAKVEKTKTPVETVLDSCEAGNTVTLTVTNGLFRNDISASCTWVVKPKEIK